MLLHLLSSVNQGFVRDGRDGVIRAEDYCFCRFIDAMLDLHSSGVKVNKVFGGGRGSVWEGG